MDRFKPWRIDGDKIVLLESEWVKVRELNALAQDDRDQAPLGVSVDGASGFRPHERPRILVDAPVFTDFDGPVVNEDGWQVWTLDGEQVWHDQKHHVLSIPLTIADLRRDFFALIDSCPNCDFYVECDDLGNVERAWPYGEGARILDLIPRPNLFLGVPIHDQPSADEKIPELLKLADLCGGHWLRYVPRGPVDLWQALKQIDHPIRFVLISGDVGEDRYCSACNNENVGLVGPCRKCGEALSDSTAPCNIDQIRDVIRQCEAAGVEVRIERLGSNVVHHVPGVGMVRLAIKDPTGAEPSEWPEDLREYAL